MTTEIATQHESALTQLPPARSGSAAAQQMLLAHAEMMLTAKKLAGALVLSTMVPTRFQGEDKAGDAAAAILYGAELGLNPIQSLQRVIPIHGMPTIESRTMAALLQSRGFRIQVTSQSGESVTVEGTAPDGTTAESTWTIERAKQAGYVPTPVPNSKLRPDVQDDWVTKTTTFRNGGSKTSVLGNMKYITDPTAMLKAKATAEVCRDLAPDVLLGIAYSREELESERYDEPAPTRTAVHSERVQSAPVSMDDIVGAPAPEPEPPAKPKRKPAAKKAEPKQEPQDAEVVEDQPPATETPEPASNPEPKPEPEQASTTAAPVHVDEESALRKAARDQNNKAIFATFNEVGLGGDDNREDRLVVIESIVGRRVESSKDLHDEELQQLRNALIDRKKAGVLEADIDDWLNLAALKEAEAAEAAAAATTTEGN